MADPNRHKPDIVIGSAHNLARSCPPMPCPAFQKWSYVQCKCVPSGLLDGQVPQIPPAGSVLQPGSLRDYSKYPIPGVEPTFGGAGLVPAGSPLPCPAGKEWKNGECVCVNSCDPGYKSGNNCACTKTACTKDVPEDQDDIPEFMIDVFSMMSIWCDKITHPNATDYLVPSAAGVIASSYGTFSVSCYKLSGTWGKLTFPGDFAKVSVGFQYSSENSESMIVCRDKWGEAAKILASISNPVFSFKKWFDKWYPNNKYGIIALGS